jgi:hypothetical protein
VAHENPAHLLSEYVLGQLDAAQANSVADAIAADPDLRQASTFLAWLAPRLVEMRDHLPGLHATGEELVTFALGQGALPNERGDWVRSHLAECAECRRLVDLIAAVELEAADPVPSGQRRRPSWTQLAVAAILVGAVFTAGLWYGNQRDGQPGHRSPLAVIHLAGLIRGGQDVVSITPTAEGVIPPLVLDCDPWVGRETADDFPLRITVTDRATGQMAASRIMQAKVAWSPDKAGLLVDLAGGRLQPAVYDLTVHNDVDAVIFQTAFRLLPR